MASGPVPPEPPARRPRTDEPLLGVVELSAGYGRILALRSVSIEVRAGEAVTIIGGNGAGKTTLLRTVAGLMRPRSGRVLLEGRDVTGRPAEAMVRAGISLVPEGRHVFPGLSVWDNLALGAYHRRREANLREEIDEVFDLFPALGARARQAAGTLSGGEQQMLAIGRGLMSKPRLLLLDEPSLGLAPLTSREVMKRLLTLRERGTTVLLVEQNARAALRVASRGYVLERGAVAVAGAREELLEDPGVRAAYLGRGFQEVSHEVDQPVAVAGPKAGEGEGP